MMIKKTIAIALLIASQWNISAQNYNVLLIPDSLKTNADLVSIFDHTSVEIVNQRSMIITQKTALTILNKNADQRANLTIGYDKHRKINNVNLVYYDALGNQIKKVKRSEFMDFAAVDGGTLYSDDREIYYNYTPISYPYTMVCEYEVSTSNTAFIPPWFPIESYNMSILNSSYTLIYPKDFKLQFKENNTSNYNIISQVLPQKSVYNLSNIPALKPEERSPAFHKIVPNVDFAINTFNLAGVDGKADTWEEFGIWMQEKLLTSRNNLSEETKSQIKQMVKGITDPKERAKIIYEYVQNKTRYISVQIGVGGWMPMYTDDVDRLGYGDCKALTFYTKSLLEVADVPAYYTAVYAGDQRMDIEKDLVSVQGNHVFLILPMEKDSVFLECTNQKIPFGIKSDFTEDRDVLSLTPQGAKIIHTPAYLPEENLQENTYEYHLDEKGNMYARINIKSYGKQYTEHIKYFDGKRPQELDEAYKNYFKHVNNITFDSLRINNNRDQKRFEESIQLSALNYATINTDGSIIFSPNAFNRFTYVPQKVINRKTSFVVDRGFKDVDTYEIQIPLTHSIGQLPDPIFIENEFGKYSNSIVIENENTLIYKRSVLIYNKTFAKENYESYRKFLKELKKQDELKILLLKK